MDQSRNKPKFHTKSMSYGDSIMLCLNRFHSFLDDISCCFNVQDFQAWEACIELPFSMVTNAGAIIMEEQKPLRKNFDHYLAACRVLQIDAIIRKPLEVENCADGTFIGTYDTELLSHGLRATEPYQSSVLLKLQGSKLKMSSILNARGHHAWTGIHPKAEGHAGEKIQPPNKGQQAELKSAS